MGENIKEEWKDIKGYEGMYQVSNLGRVRSLSRKMKNKNGFSIKKGKLKKVNCNKNGYCDVSLYKNNKEKRYKVHRLVAQAFIPNFDNKPEVNHIDGNKANNIVTNLEWVTKTENLKHAYEKGLKSNNYKKIKIKCNETGAIFNSTLECSKALNIDRRDLYKQLRGKIKTVKGYTFKKI